MALGRERQLMECRNDGEDDDGREPLGDALALVLSSPPEHVETKERLAMRFGQDAGFTSSIDETPEGSAPSGPGDSAL